MNLQPENISVLSERSDCTLCNLIAVASSGFYSLAHRQNIYFPGSEIVGYLAVCYSCVPVPGELICSAAFVAFQRAS